MSDVRYRSGGALRLGTGWWRANVGGRAGSSAPRTAVLFRRRARAGCLIDDAVPDAGILPFDLIEIAWLPRRGYLGPLIDVGVERLTSKRKNKKARVVSIRRLVKGRDYFGYLKTRKFAAVEGGRGLGQ